MHNLSTVIKFEIIRTIKKPLFWISILAMPLLIAMILGISYFSQKTSDATQAELNKQSFSLIVQDETGFIGDKTLDQIKASRSTNKQDSINRVISGKIDAFFYYPADIIKQPIEVYNKNDGLMANDKYTFLAKNLLTTGASELIGSEKLIAVVKGGAMIKQVNYEKGVEADLIGRMIMPGLFLVIFYAVIVLLANQMLTSTTEEKENRVTEMLLTSINSKALIIGKIIALVALGFIQIITLLLPVIFGYIFARDLLNIPDLSNFLQIIKFEFWPIFIGAGLLVSGFLLFTGLLVGIGAAAPTAKEANSFFGFVILTMFLPFYFIPMIISPSSSVIVTWLSFFPLTAPVTLMIRNAVGTVPLSEAIIGLILVFIFGIIAINISIRIFRYGTLEYSKRLSLKNIFFSKDQKRKV